MAQTYSLEVTPVALYIRDSGNNGDSITARLRAQKDDQRRLDLPLASPDSWVSWRPRPSWNASRAIGSTHAPQVMIPSSGDLGWPSVVTGAFSVAAVNADGDLTQRLQTRVRPVRESLLPRPILPSRSLQPMQAAMVDPKALAGPPAYLPSTRIEPGSSRL